MPAHPDEHRTQPAVMYEPMLAVSWEHPFSDPDWVFEPKFDGVRALAHVDRGDLVVLSRTGRVITHTYPELGTLRGQRLVVDGEVVAYDDQGRPSFERLQGRIHATGRRALELSGTIPIGYVVFDLLELDGRAQIDLPLEARTDLLAGRELPECVVRVEQIPEHGEALFEAVAAQGLEGMMAKRLGSPYRPGVRSSDWRKVPHMRRVRAVVGGFTPGERRRSTSFGALLIGMWDGPLLRWAGGVGTGFDTMTLRAIRAALDQMTTDVCPFHPSRDLPRNAVWVDPQLVAEIAFKEWTSVGRLRAPSFKGFSDQPVAAVTWEAEGGPDR